jgi:hypothetical protein
MFEVDEHTIYLVIVDKDSNTITRRDITFEEMSEKVQQYILNDPGIKKYGYIVFD